MNTLNIRPLLAGACALALLATASAEVPATPTPKAPSKADLAKYDADKDGRLDEAESARWQAAKAAVREERLAKYDSDRDGRIDREEKVAEDADKAEAREARKAAAEARKAERAKEKGKPDRRP